MDQRPGWDENMMGQQHVSFVSKIIQLIKHAIRHTRKHIVYVCEQCQNSDWLITWVICNYTIQTLTVAFDE